MFRNPDTGKPVPFHLYPMKQAIEDYVERAEEQEELRAELIRRHRRYQETGLHLTGDEVNDWIEATLRGEKPSKLEPHT